MPRFIVKFVNQNYVVFDRQWFGHGLPFSLRRLAEADAARRNGGSNGNSSAPRRHPR